MEGRIKKVSGGRGLVVSASGSPIPASFVTCGCSVALFYFLLLGTGRPQFKLKKSRVNPKWDGQSRARELERGREGRRRRRRAAKQPRKAESITAPCHGLTSPPTNAAPRIQTNGFCASVSFPPLPKCQIMITRHISIQRFLLTLCPHLPPN